MMKRILLSTAVLALGLIASANAITCIHNENCEPSHDCIDGQCILSTHDKPFLEKNLHKDCKACEDTTVWAGCINSICIPYSHTENTCNSETSFRCAPSQERYKGRCRNKEGFKEDDDGTPFMLEETKSSEFLV